MMQSLEAELIQVVHHKKAVCVAELLQRLWLVPVLLQLPLEYENLPSLHSGVDKILQ